MNKTNRRDFLKATAASAAVLTLGRFADGAPAAPASKRPPNIVLILADDMGPGEPSYAGGLVPTPALDSLVKEGMQFTDAHTTSSVCTPTRYGILTGRYNWRSRLKSSVLFSPTDKALMDPARLNLPNFLQNAGYHTACVGKWHLGADWARLPKNANADKKKRSASWRIDYTKPFKNGPTDVGFDEAFFILSSLDMAPYVYLRNNRAVSIPTVNRGFPHNEYNKFQRIGAAAEDFQASNCLGDWAKESRSYIKRRAKDAPNKPFFLYLPLTSPHTPIAPSKAFKGRYKQYSWYADFMAETDWVVAQVLEQLKESGVENDTLVIFTSDNGFAPYVKIPKMFAAGYKPSGSWRGAKATIYEGGHRVPFIARWPGKIAPSTKSDATVCTTDFFATFAELLGKKNAIPDNAAEDSFSFYPCLQGKKGEIRPFTIHHSISGKFAIRKGDWKLIMTTNAGGGWGLPGRNIKTTAKFVQLYNLKDDPGETKNLEDARPKIVEELVNDLAGALRNGRTTPGKKQTNEGWPYRDAATKKKFPQLKE
ncbi:MAG: sulfatase-like hydrolase/transferase [Phycisphaerales bacterium]|jgi:arylsulfatase A|nr:sulfatase-like hydrolase/transferase [Phycisphaerales bacterium]